MELLNSVFKGRSRESCVERIMSMKALTGQFPDKKGKGCMKIKKASFPERRLFFNSPAACIRPAIVFMFARFPEDPILLSETRSVRGGFVNEESSLFFRRSD